MPHYQFDEECPESMMDPLPFYVRPASSFGLFGLNRVVSNGWTYGGVKFGVGDVVFGSIISKEYRSAENDPCICFYGSDCLNDWSDSAFDDFVVYAGESKCNFGSSHRVFSWRGAHWVICDYLEERARLACKAKNSSYYSIVADHGSAYKLSLGCYPAIVNAYCDGGVWMVGGRVFRDRYWFCGLPRIKSLSGSTADSSANEAGRIVDKIVAITLCMVKILGDVKPGSLAS